MDSTLLDSNLLLRRLQPAHPMFAVTDRALQTTFARGEPVYVCPQNHAEFWAVATRPVAANGLGFSTARADTELTQIERDFDFLPDSPAVLPVWRRLVVGAGVSGKATHDARLLAVALVYGVTRLLTFNTSDFTRFAVLAPSVQILDPNGA